MQLILGQSCFKSEQYNRTSSK